MYIYIHRNIYIYITIIIYNIYIGRDSHPTYVLWWLIFPMNYPPNPQIMAIHDDWMMHSGKPHGNQKKTLWTAPQDSIRINFINFTVLNGELVNFPFWFDGIPMFDPNTRRIPGFRQRCELGVGRGRCAMGCARRLQGQGWDELRIDGKPADLSLVPWYKLN